MLEINDLESIQNNHNKVDSHKTLFVRKYGIFQHVWMGLGLYSGAPTTFQSTMQKSLEEFVLTNLLDL